MTRKQFFLLVLSFLTIFLLFMLHKGYLTHDIHIAFSLGPFKDRPIEYGIVRKMQIAFQYALSVFGGSLSNIYWSLEALLRFFREDWFDKVISLTFFSVSLAHIYVSYRLLKHMWQVEVLKWYWWGIWVANCYIWFFMGSIIPRFMRL
jgi:hypothetical protein